MLLPKPSIPSLTYRIEQTILPINHAPTQLTTRSNNITIPNSTSRISLTRSLLLLQCSSPTETYRHHHHDPYYTSKKNQKTTNIANTNTESTYTIPPHIITDADYSRHFLFKFLCAIHAPLNIFSAVRITNETHQSIRTQALSCSKHPRGQRSSSLGVQSTSRRILDLFHPDANGENSTKFFDQIAKVNTTLAGVVDSQARTIELKLTVEHVHL